MQHPAQLSRVDQRPRPAVVDVRSAHGVGDQHDAGVAAGDWQARAIIDDEAWSFVAEDADHNPVTTFKGTADELVTARGDDSPQGYHSINYRFDGTASDGAGHTLHLIVKGRLRSGRDSNITRFDYAVQTCTAQ